MVCSSRWSLALLGVRNVKLGSGSPSSRLNVRPSIFTNGAPTPACMRCSRSLTNQLNKVGRLLYDFNIFRLNVRPSIAVNGAPTPACVRCARSLTNQLIN